MKNKYLLYMFFAFLSVLVNITTQYILKSLLVESSLKDFILLNNNNLNLAFLIQIASGTITGFILKFILDKYIVFKNQTSTDKLGETFKQLIIYGCLAIFTTAVFWGTEIAFKLIFSFENSDIVGGVIGLAIGYTIKFFLDKKFVFNNPNPQD